MPRILCACLLVAAFHSSHAGQPIANELTTAQAIDGSYISWREHRIDDSELGRIELSGSDGFATGDLDGDGHLDIVSVHESDTIYHGKPVGNVRIAWGSSRPDLWTLTSLAAGPEAAAAEDVSIADANGDGHLDIVVAAELAHLVYFQNPGRDFRTAHWPRVIPRITTERGSYIRVFFADFNNDGRPEVVAPNKGEQNPDVETPQRRNISIYHLPENPLDGDLWREQVLTQVRIPINSHPLDLDRDGDLDIVVGSRGEGRILWLENQGDFRFVEHRIIAKGKPEDAALTGFNLDFADLNGDGRLDIISTAWPSYLLWLAAPANPADPWPTYILGEIAPDQLVSVHMADLDGDADLDAFVGAYSRGPRDSDGAEVTAADPLGRIAWFANPGHSAATDLWPRHDISRRKRGMYDKWQSRDLDGDGDLDFIGTRGNSEPFDGVIWLEQVRTKSPGPRFKGSRAIDSEQMPLAQ